jgi:D-alanyl-D-alanine dipeptidase
MRVFMKSLFVLPLVVAGAVAAEEPSAQNGSRIDEPMVDLAKFASRIVIELRYATNRNLTKRVIYPKDARCFARRGTAERLLVAQNWLDRHAEKGTRLKIWDAYRPAWAQRQLWQVYPDREYLGDPARGGSLHTWGVCVDATLVDASGSNLKMPTDFDVLSPAARTAYEGGDKEILRNLRWLQQSMGRAGFMVVADEWWHFVDRDWKQYGPIDLAITSEMITKRTEPPNPASPPKTKLSER